MVKTTTVFFKMTKVLQSNRKNIELRPMAEHIGGSKVLT